MLLKDKNILIYGVRNDRSLAWGCAESAAREGARLALAYLGEREEAAVRKLVEKLPNPESVLLAPCDLTDEDQVAQLHAMVGSEMGTLHGIIHAVAFAKKEDLDGRYVDTSRDGFLLALEISAYSFVSAARHAAPLMTEGGSIITLTYLGSEKFVPHYNVMGVAKAALEASVRYIAADLGRDRIRVNALSPGATMTLSARGISGFTDLYKVVPERAPLAKNTTIDEVGDTSVWLLSDYSRGVTGEVIFVDSGMHMMAAF